MNPKGHVTSEATKRKISLALSGRKRPDLSLMMLGRKNHRYINGHPICIDCLKQIPR